MHIGIITWFDYENYGTKLQAIASYVYLKRLGHEVKFVDFFPPKKQKNNNVNFLGRVQNKANYLALKYAAQIYEDKLCTRSYRMKQVISDLCECTEKIMNDREYIDACNQFDLLICGSDQIWNPNWYHPYYYADFAEIQSRKISYAPSIGVHVIPENIEERMRESLKKFETISVREERAAELLQRIIGYHPKKVVDPTMLLSKNEWENLIFLHEKKVKPYVLCYFLSDNRNHWLAARKFAKERDLDLAVIPQGGFSFFQKAEIHADTGVREFLELIKNSQCVLTDSFHGTVFSILFEKEFYIFERFKQDQCVSQNDRVIELVKQFDVQNHLLKFNSRKIVDQPPIDYKKIRCTLNKLKAESESFLISAIEGRREECAE